MARPPARYCKHGHDTHVVGRNSNSWCNECHRIKNREVAKTRRKAEYGKAFLGPTLPFAPLEQRLVAEGIAIHKLASNSSLKRYRLWGIPIATGDEWCVRYLAVHPFGVWGPTWYAA